jgi:hypothetical protein
MLLAQKRDCNSIGHDTAKVVESEPETVLFYPVTSCGQADFAGGP